MLGNKGQMATNLPFILAFTTFFIVLAFLSVSLASSNVQWVKNSPASFSAPTCGTGIIILDGLLGCAWNYLTAFFTLFTISTEFALFNSVILVGLFFAMGWAILSLLRGGGG